jgi:hypothetical protein
MARKIRIVRNPPQVSPTRPIPLSKILEGPLQARFWGRVQKGRPDECWPFTGAPTTGGYGVVNIRLGPHHYQKVRAHVVALMTATQQENTLNALHSLKCTTKMCCNPQHLRWGGRKQNALDQRDLGRVPGQKLTWDDVEEIREMLKDGWKQEEIAAVFGIDQTQVSSIKTGRSWNPKTKRQAA